MLERLQCYAYEDDPRAPRWTDDPKQVKKLRDIFKSFEQSPDSNPTKERSRRDGDSSYAELLANLRERLKETLPTRYEDAISWSILSEAVRLLNRHLTASYRDWKSPRVGTLPLGLLNARSVPLPEIDSSLVIVNSGIFSFVHELTKISLDTIPVNVNNDNIDFDVDASTFDSGARHDQVLLMRLSKALEDVAKHRRVAGQAPATKIYKRLLIEMDTAVEVFAVGHEFGHVFLKHSDQGDARSPLEKSDGESLSKEAAQAATAVHVSNRSWGQETAADIFGFMLLKDLIYRDKTTCMTPFNGVDITDYCMLAPVIFFTFAQMSDDAEYIIKNKATPPKVSDDVRRLTLSVLTSAPDTELSAEEQQIIGNSTHPPNWARALLAQAQYEKLTASEPHSEEQRSMAAMAIAMLHNTQTMWGDLSPIWVKIVQKAQHPTRSRIPQSKPAGTLPCRDPYLTRQ